MTTSRIVLLVAATALLSGCSGAASDAGSSVTASPTPSSQGTLHGRLIRVGGPAPGAAVPLAGAVTISGPTASRDVTVGTDGTFSIDLPPGKYTILGHSPLVLVDNVPMSCPGTKVAVVRGGSPTEVDAVCSIP
jgi:hypothetical protein